MLQDSLTDFATEMGLKLARLLLADEVNQRCGPRYQRVLTALDCLVLRKGLDDKRKIA
jgi:hypothetical protein